MRGISPVIATVIIVSIAISISVVVALWTSGIISGYMGIERLDIYDSYCLKYNGDYYMILYLKNSGTKPITIDNVFVDNKPYNQMGFKAYFVNEEVFDPQDLNNGHLNIYMNISGTTSSTGSVCSGDLAPSINVTYGYPVTFSIDYLIRFDNFSYTVGSNVEYTMVMYALYMRYSIGFANGTINNYILHVIYYDNYKQLNITLLNPITLSRTTLYSGYVNLGSTLTDRNWHDLRVVINTYDNLSLWRISLLLDNKPVVSNVPFYNGTTTNAVNVTVSTLFVNLPSLSIPTTTGVPVKVEYSIDIDKLGVYANNTVIKEYDFSDKNALSLSYRSNYEVEYLYKDLMIYLYSALGFVSEPSVQIIVVIGQPLPYTLMPGQKAVLVMVSSNVSPGTMYSIIVHSSSGYRYPTNIRAP